MNKQTLIFVGLAVVVGFIYYQTHNDEINAPKNNGDVGLEVMEDDNDSMKEDDDDAMMESGDDVVVIGEQTYETYENKAIGYTINRPTNWWWEHFHQARLNETHPDVTDIFAASLSPLPTLSDIYDAKIVIEVSSTDGSPYVEKFTSKNVAIDGRNATRHEGVREGNQVVEYQLTVGTATIRFIYSATEIDEKELSVFEEIVKSFTL